MLQNSGLSSDYRSVLEELITRDPLLEVFFAGYSVGGNLLLKMAGKLRPDVCPALGDREGPGALRIWRLACD